jgi:hypothetical protein
MSPFAIAVLVLVALAAVLAGACTVSAGKPAKPETGASMSADPAGRAQLEAKLRALGAAPRPPRQILSAECYEPPPSYQRAEYICPKDGRRTVYPLPDGCSPATLRFLNEELPAMRSFVAQLKGKLDVELDESGLCRECKPDYQTPGWALIVRYQGESPELLT